MPVHGTHIYKRVRQSLGLKETQPGLIAQSGSARTTRQPVSHCQKRKLKGAMAGPKQLELASSNSCSSKTS